MTLVKINRNLPTFDRFMDEFFGDVNSFLGREQLGSVPMVNVVEEAEQFRLEVAAPGMRKEDFQVTLEDGVLRIGGHRQAQQEDNQPGKYTRREFNYASFERAFRLPNTVSTDQVEARYTDGVLHVRIPKLEEAKAKGPRTISIA